jgi:phospholipid/cholesterol/gamma-HCH transport system substrate-binding protein
MITGLIRKQLIAFTAAAVIGIVVLGVYFMHVPETLGIGRYTLRADFAQGAGLYPDAQVNYLGTPIGTVKTLKLTATGIVVSMSIKDGIGIPSDARAEIHSVSAVGEQYVEFVPPAHPGTANLRDGDVVPVSRTSEPVEIGPVLDNVASLVNSLPKQQLAALLDETSTALNGRDQDLQSILDGSNAFLQAADTAFPQTASLLEKAQPLLTTVNASGGHIASLTTKLAQVTDELKAGNSDLQTLLAQGPTFSATTSGFLDDLDKSLPGLLGPANTVTGVLATYKDYVAQLLSDYPTALSFVQSVTLPDADIDAVRLTLANANKPSECTNGFLPVSKWRAPDDNGTAYTPLYYCAAKPSDPRDVKGARNVPCPGDPARREPTPELCQEK